MLGAAGRDYHNSTGGIGPDSHYEGECDGGGDESGVVTSNCRGGGSKKLNKRASERDGRAGEEGVMIRRVSAYSSSKLDTEATEHGRSDEDAKATEIGPSTDVQEVDNEADGDEDADGITGGVMNGCRESDRRNRSEEAGERDGGDSDTCATKRSSCGGGRGEPNKGAGRQEGGHGDAGASMRSSRRGNDGDRHKETGEQVEGGDSDTGAMKRSSCSGGISRELNEGAIQQDGGGGGTPWARSDRDDGRGNRNERAGEHQKNNNNDNAGMRNTLGGKEATSRCGGKRDGDGDAGDSWDVTKRGIDGGGRMLSRRGVEHKKRKGDDDYDSSDGGNCDLTELGSDGGSRKPSRRNVEHNKRKGDEDHDGSDGNNCDVTGSNLSSNIRRRSGEAGEHTNVSYEVDPVTRNSSGNSRRELNKRAGDCLRSRGDGNYDGRDGDNRDVTKSSRNRPTDRGGGNGGSDQSHSGSKRPTGRGGGNAESDQSHSGSKRPMDRGGGNAEGDRSNRSDHTATRKSRGSGGREMNRRAGERRKNRSDDEFDGSDGDNGDVTNNCRGGGKRKLSEGAGEHNREDGDESTITRRVHGSRKKPTNFGGVQRKSNQSYGDDDAVTKNRRGSRKRKMNEGAGEHGRKDGNKNDAKGDTHNREDDEDGGVSETNESSEDEDGEYSGADEDGENSGADEHDEIDEHDESDEYEDDDKKEKDIGGDEDDGSDEDNESDKNDDDYKEDENSGSDEDDEDKQNDEGEEGDEAGSDEEGAIERTPRRARRSSAGRGKVAKRKSKAALRGSKGARTQSKSARGKVRGEELGDKFEDRRSTRNERKLKGKEQRRLQKKWGVMAEETSDEESDVQEGDNDTESQPDEDEDVRWLRQNYACNQEEALTALDAARAKGKDREAAGKAMQRSWNIPSLSANSYKRGKRRNQSKTAREEDGKATKPAANSGKSSAQRRRAAAKEQEFKQHVNDTNAKEKRRETSLAMMREALTQLDRRQRGKVLTRKQRELARIGETLSPARVYGYRAGGGAMSDTDYSSRKTSDSSSQFSSDEEILRFSDGSDESSDDEKDALPPPKYDHSRESPSASQAKKRTRISLPASETTRSRRAGQNPKLDESIRIDGLREHGKPSKQRSMSRIEDRRKAGYSKQKESQAKFEQQVGELCQELPITRRQANELLRSGTDTGKDPVVEARALYWKRECEASRIKEADAESRARELSQSVARSASQAAATQGNKSGDFQPTIDLPEDWDVGREPKGGVNFLAFKRIMGQVERYNRKIGKKGPKVALKDLVTQDLRPGIEGRCGFDSTIWNDVDDENAPGMSDADFVAKLKKILRPERKADFKSAFESMRMEERGQKGNTLLNALESWGTRWLQKEREAEEAGVVISPAWMKLAFKDAVESIYRFKRWLKGRTWPSTRGSAIWYKLLCDKLKKKVSKDEEDEREAKEDKRRKGNDEDGPYQRRQPKYEGGRSSGPNYSRGGGNSDRAKEDYRRSGYDQRYQQYDKGRERGVVNNRGATYPNQERDDYCRNLPDWNRDSRQHQERYDRIAGQSKVPPPVHTTRPSDAAKMSRLNEHSGEPAFFANHGGEPMTYQWNRGRGRGQAAYQPPSSRGGGIAGRTQGANLPTVKPQWNKSEEEAARTGRDDQLPNGPRWHDSSDPACNCRSPDCGEKQEIPYCQGCNQHHHDRANCFKRNDERFNAEGYWCINKKGQGPIPSLNGTFPGSPKANKANPEAQRA
jgi:hypothetical protein